MRKTLAVLGVVIALGAMPAFAAPGGDSPRGPVENILALPPDRLDAVRKAFKRLSKGKP